MNPTPNAHDIVIVGAKRTPTGKFLGSLSQKKAYELGAIAIQAALQQSGIDPATVYEAIMGHVVSAGAGQAPARRAALLAGLPDTVGATSVNKVCGSGLKAVMLAANSIRAGEADVFVAGGMESMSQAPHLAMNTRQGHKYGQTPLEDAIIHDGLWCGFENWVMGNAAEFIAKQFEVTRQEMDEFSLKSHEKAANATASGRFKNEIVPLDLTTRKTSTTLTHDETIRAQFTNGNYQLTTSYERLAKLRPAFEKDGLVTAGNAPGLNDGASALVLTSRAEAQRQSLTPLARIVGYTHSAVTPQWIFSAPARAIPRLLQKINWSLDDVDLIELNEAFSSQALANGLDIQKQGLNWNWDKVNIHGGAIALGHPLGSSGSRVLVTLLHALQQHNGRRGIASLCLGGGEAVALAIQLENS